ncbi:MAG: 3-isopropylmalate dehydratase small subunit [Endomicrobiia bacterium]|nr:3-isopropylmalate dehydratase small subunit [Endomicrobiia bacterium]
MIIKGKVHKYGDNINTDEIIPARHLSTTDPDDLGKHCLEDLDAAFMKKVRKGDILSVGKNFGCGSSREHAVISLKAAGVAAIVAESYARIFFRNAINTGLPVFVSKETSKIKNGEIIAINAHKGEIKNVSSGASYRAEPMPPFVENIIKSGGLISYVRKKKISSH